MKNEAENAIQPPTYIFPSFAFRFWGLVLQISYLYQRDVIKICKKLDGNELSLTGSVKNFSIRFSISIIVSL